VSSRVVRLCLQIGLSHAKLHRLLLYGVRGHDASKAQQRLPGRLDCNAEMFHEGTRQRAAREEGYWASVSFECCSRPVSCASGRQPAPLTAKRERLWTISFLFSIRWVSVSFQVEENGGGGGDLHRVSKVVTCQPGNQFPCPEHLITPQQQTCGYSHPGIRAAKLLIPLVLSV
jgi:hypothetical protein